MKTERNQNDKKKSPGRNRRCTIPVSYPWKVLSALVKDAEVNVSSEAFAEVLKELRGVIRRRSVADYVSFCDRFSLSTVNRDETFLDSYSSGTGADRTVKEIRFLRILTAFQKYDFDDSPFDKEATALSNFYEVEKRCAQSNQDPLFLRYKDTEDDGTDSTLDCVFTFRVMRHARAFIRRVIGGTCDYNSIFASSSHGPGATSKRKGDDSIPIRKYQAPIDITSGASDFFLHYLYQEDRWLRSLLRQYNNEAFLRGTPFADSSTWLSILARDDDFFHYVMLPTEESRVLFVPKDARKLRTICAEPTGNVFLQLGIDRFIRKRLKQRVGIDLSTQTKNQMLAASGAISNTLTTLDLASASDSIALSILELFPADWQHVMKSLRTPVGLLDGQKIVFEKLSSMGNGFTFVTETLVFSSLLYGVITVSGGNWQDFLDRIAVYGDDIICPTKFVSDYIYVLRRCGFRINTAKTFSNGPVRESCGKDFYKDHEISRPTIKELPRQNWELTRDHNRFFRLTVAYGLDLRHTLEKILSWHTDQKFGPFCDDEIGWLFAEYADQLPSSTHQDAINWQQPVYRLKKTTVTHPTADMSVQDRVFVPMMFLGTESKRPWYELNIHDIGRKFDVGTPTDTMIEALSFQKIKRRVRVTVISLPAYLWKPRPLTE